MIGGFGWEMGLVGGKAGEALVGESGWMRGVGTSGDGVGSRTV
jgi:hypothetical protein